MGYYADLAAVLSFLVEFMLILGTNSFCRYPLQWNRTALGAGVSGVYAFVCLMPQCAFLGHMLWRLICLLLVCLISFGITSDSLRRWAVFFLLHAALEGLTVGLGDGSALSMLLGAVILLLLCMVGLYDKQKGSRVSVELSYGAKSLRLNALVDTGNMLKDPLTGRPVLIVGADAAQKLTGLTKQQLERPIETLQAHVLPGLQLIPYESIGCSGGMLLGMKFHRVVIGSWKGSTLVAFAPEGLGAEKPYQALLGGNL